MNILIYSHVPLWTVHHAETIELALRHLNAGDRVVLLSCDGHLASCPANSFHAEAKCQACVSQTKYTLDKVLGGRVEDLRLRLEDEPTKLPNFDSLESLTKYSLEGVPFGELVVSQLVTDTRDSYLDYEKVRERAGILIQNAIALFNAAKNTMRAESIDKAYVWNGRRCSDGPVVYAAIQEGVDYAIYISGVRKNTFAVKRQVKIHALEASKNYMEALYRSVIESGDAGLLSREAKIFFDTQRHGGGDYPGCMHFAKDFEAEKRLPAAFRESPLVIFTSSFWEYFGMFDYLHEYPPYKNHYEALRTILADPRLEGLGTVVVRWHPNLKTCGPQERKVINDIINSAPSHVVHIPPESSISSYALMESAAKIVTFGSTIGIEAAYYGKPSILLGRAVYEDSGAVYRPRDHEEFMGLVTLNLPPLPKEGAVKYAYWYQCQGNEEFVHLSQDDLGKFAHGNIPINYRTGTFAARLRLGLTRSAKALGVYEELRSLKRAVANISGKIRGSSVVFFKK